jgi:hypothetical protein
MMVQSKNLAAGFGLVMVAACSPVGGGAAALPAGETNLSCAALIYAANQLVDDKVIADAGGLIKDKHIWTLTRYATAHAKESGITDGNEAFNVAKLEALKMMGKISAPNSAVSSSNIGSRATACLKA